MCTRFLRFVQLLALIDCTALQAQYSSVLTAAGTGSAGYVNGLAQTAQFDHPYGVCHDPATGDIYIADAFNHVIRKLSNGSVSLIAGTPGVSGDILGQALNARFDTPTGVFFKDGYLYICDNLNNKIKRMDGLGQVTLVAGSGISGGADGPVSQATFYQPKSIAVDDSGTVYVADYESHKIRKVKNGVVTTVAGTGTPGSTFGPGTSSQLHRPRDLCIAPDGTIYFVDLMNHRVKKLTPSGMVEPVAGNGIPGWLDGSGSAARFNTPVAIDWLDTSTLLVLDAVNPRLRMVAITGDVVTLAGSGNAGFQDGALMSAEFALPQDICLDGECSIYIGDRDNMRIRKLRRDGECVLHLPDLSSSQIALSIRPNPASTTATLLWPGPSAPTTVELIDARGARVQAEVRRFADRVELDVAALRAGLYTVRVSGDGRVGSARLVRE